jgi:hypothetical protein
VKASNLTILALSFELGLMEDKILFLVDSNMIFTPKNIDNPAFSIGLSAKLSFFIVKFF